MLSRTRFLFLGLCLASGTLPAAPSAPGDLPGSPDHPVVSHFAGSRIIGYQQVAFDEAVLPLGPFKSGAPYRFAHSESLQGKITRIAYAAPSDKSTLEVFDNFAQALDAAGFSTRFSCAGASCGNAASFSDAAISPLLDPMRARNAMMHTLYAVEGDARALTAHLGRPAGAVDVSLLVSRQDKHPVGVLLQVVEAKPMATGQVSVITQHGRGRVNHPHRRNSGVATSDFNLRPRSLSCD